MSEKSEKILRELGYIPAKTKQPQPENLTEAQGRDSFQTPNYAVNLLLPFMPKGVTTVWECAAGLGKIVNVFKDKGYNVFGSDINPKYGFGGFNFLKDHLTWIDGVWVIVTNPPFSLKQKFYLRCLDYKVPFALLIPADYSGWIIEACRNGAEKIIPTRRIDYLTPNILRRIRYGEVWEIVRKEYPQFSKLETFRSYHPNKWEEYLNLYTEVANFNTINDTPVSLLSKYSSSDFHSMWLTHGFNLGRTETFVELSLEEKKNNI